MHMYMYLYTYLYTYMYIPLLATAGNVFISLSNIAAPDIPDATTAITIVAMDTSLLGP